MKNIIEITQDAAGVIESGSCEYYGFYTGGIQSCLISVYECNDACVLVHDSGQLKISDITKLVKKYGDVKRVTVAFGPELNRRHHQVRLDKILLDVGCVDRNVDLMERNKSNFAFLFPINGDASTIENMRPETVQAIPDKDKRMSMVELNNFFLKPNSQKLRLEVQFAKGKYNPPRGLDLSLKDMLKIVKKQPDFFFANLDFLEKAHKAEVISLPKALLEVAKIFNVSEFMYRQLLPEERRQQNIEFRKFIN
ncbi:hypothetical protein [Modicisalibacter luteus]|uniref:Uncharacterized protein n=1 Tax=Modicisalibacter luteus TaxID=453962 RepID=A0ABV7M616_9GAMM|nr:hypothetical protein [Halomonas lutea]GHA88911.1 hypothetical protein GCM10007159_08020 [Halomonas lutea]